jgi:diamine N-acetyltransferase
MGMGTSINLDRLKFVGLNSSPELFFSILPVDWKDSIQPVWKDYLFSSDIIAVMYNKEIIAGGIIFSSVSPDMLENYKIAEHWLNLGYKYLAYLFVTPKYQKLGIGTFWLKEIFKKFPSQKFFLTIEDYMLKDFYISNNFKLISELETKEGKNWLLAKI